MAKLSINNYNEMPWLNHYESGVPFKIEFEKNLLPDFLNKSAKDFPDRNALNFEGYKVTYK